MSILGTSYKIDLRVVNSPLEAGYQATVGDVFIEVARNDSFIINVTTKFLEKHPDILFEVSSLHEVCHVINDDLTGFHRNFAHPEAAEEYCVLQVVGESRYREYLQAYATYQHWGHFDARSVSPEREGSKARPSAKRDGRGGQNRGGVFEKSYGPEGTPARL